MRSELILADPAGRARHHKAFVVDIAAVPFLDSTAANAMGSVAAMAQRQGIHLFMTGASPRRALRLELPFFEEMQNRNAPILRTFTGLPKGG
jgi:anti-anti-sigma regulatory factor